MLAFGGLILAGALYQFAGGVWDSRRYRGAGRVISCGSTKLYVHEQGAGSPAVILESGLAATSLSWSFVQPKIAEFTRVLSYDRAGLGSSSGSRAPLTLESMISDLRASLSALHVHPPYILVGHSFGAMLIRAFAHFYPAEVCGLVFVDPVSLEFWANCSPEDQARLALGARLSRRGAWLARFGVARLALTVLAVGGRRFPMLVGKAAAGRAAQLMARLAGEVRKLPPAVWPVVRSHWSRPKSFRAMAAHLECLPASAKAAMDMPIEASIPFIVLSASSATATELREREEWVRQSRRARHIQVPESSHWLPLDHPGQVIEAVRELVEEQKSLAGR